MKKLFSFFLSLIASVGTMFASDTQVNGIWYNFDSSAKTAEVTYRGEYIDSYDNEYTGSVIIPSSVVYESITYSVTSIGSYAFVVCSSLTSVTIPNSVTSIGNTAFAGCTGLTSVTIPNSVTSIGNSAFQNCSGLTSVAIPSSVTSIGVRAFSDCSSLTSVTIPNSVTSIGEYAFMNCAGLTSVTIPNSVTSIGAFAFYGCSSLTEFVVPNSSCATGENGAILIACSNLTSVSGPALLFYMADAYLYLYSISRKLQTIVVTGGEMNENCLLALHVAYKSLKSVDLSAATNTELSDEAFKGCYNLETLKLPAGLTKISYMAVADCKNLKAIDIPASVVEIEQSAFEDCRSIQTITFGGVQPTSSPARSAAAQAVSQLRKIGNWAFYNAHELQHLDIPEGVEEIGDGAFYGCTYLEDLVLPSSVQSIGDNCFALCSKLTQIVVTSPEPPTIAPKTFYDVKRQIPVYVPDNCVDAYKDDPLWGEFDIQGVSNMPSALANTSADATRTGKVIRNGQLFILRDGKTYTVQGQKLR